MGASQRRKGANGERELVRLLGDELGRDVVRNINQVRDGGHDLLGVSPFAIECKRAAKPELRKWWVQTVDQAIQVHMKPALAYRLDRQGWQVLVPLGDLAPDKFPTYVWEYDLRFAATLSLPAFCTLVREEMGETHE